MEKEEEGKGDPPWRKRGKERKEEKEERKLFLFSVQCNTVRFPIAQKISLCVKGMSRFGLPWNPCVKTRKTAAATAGSLKPCSPLISAVSCVSLFCSLKLRIKTHYVTSGRKLVRTRF